MEVAKAWADPKVGSDAAEPKAQFSVVPQEPWEHEDLVRIEQLRQLRLGDAKITGIFRIFRNIGEILSDWLRCYPHGFPDFPHLLSVAEATTIHQRKSALH